MESVHARPEDVPLQDTFETKEKLLKYIRDGVIGKDVQIRTPYGMKPLHYCDYTASGRSLSFIEDYIRDQILPIYANTHTLNSRTAKQTIYSREEARDIIKRCVNGNERDAVIFNGTGSTGAVNHLVKSLDIRYKKDGVEHHTEGCADNFCQVNRWKTLDCTLCNMSFSNQGFYEDHEKSEIHQKSYAKYKETHQIKFTEPPVVFVSVMEHNSNYLPWYEKDKDIIIEFVNLDLETGEINYKELEDIISKYQSYNGLKIGTFSAGSNITGILNDVDYISYLMHKAGGLCFIDYAAAAPYVDINVNGKTDRFSRVSQEEAHFCYKDAIFISPHKFVGGPDTPGILVCKKKLLCNNKPIQVGGGIVFFVDKESHMYIRGVEEREEAGTPSIIGVIRAGLSFQLKEQLTPEFIEHKEYEIVQYVNQRFSQMKNIVSLGNNELDKVPIYSFMVRHQGKFLHFHFVGKLLNDLFGIQTRTGCSCAAVYGQQLLGIDLPLARKYKDALCHGHEMLRMGYVRLNFGYFMSQEDIDYILDAIEFVGKYGWMFLPDYTFDKEFAEFYVHADTDHKERNWIGEIDYTSGMMKYKNSNAFINDEAQLPSKEDVFKQAKETLITRILNYRHIYGKSAIDQRNIVDEEYQHLVFFIYPSEVLQDIENIIATHKDLKFEDLEAYITEDIEYASEIPFKPLDYTKKEPSQKEEIKEQSAPEKEDKDEDDWLEEDCLPGMALMDEDEVEQKEEILPIIEPSKEIMKLVGEAIKDFDMIREGDGILVALSGGKDSLSLLNILRYLQKKAPVRFKLGAVTIDPKTVEYDPSPLKGYLKKLGVPYFYEEDNLIERAATSMQNNSICAFCSRMKRGMIYTCARREGYNVIAMGQHLDDLAESFVMSAFNNGTLRTMKAHYTIDSKDLRVIRPLVYCREKIFKSFSESCKLPVITENCPACFSEPKERHRVKLLLAQQEHEIPTIFSSLLNCMRPLMTMNLKDLVRLKDKLSKEDKSKEPEPNFCT